MWITTNQGFISIVAHREHPGVFVIRARNKEALTANGFFKPADVITSPNADYRFRVFASSAKTMAFLNNELANVDYDNFKNSIKDAEVKRMASSIWGIAFRFQEQRYNAGRSYAGSKNWPGPLNPNSAYGKRGIMSEDNDSDDLGWRDGTWWDDTRMDDIVGTSKRYDGDSLFAGLTGDAVMSKESYLRRFVDTVIKEFKNENISPRVFVIMMGRWDEYNYATEDVMVEDIVHECDEVMAEEMEPYIDIERGDLVADEEMLHDVIRTYESRATTPEEFQAFISQMIL